MELRFSGELWFWRGPSPWHFVWVPPDASERLRDAGSLASYGWGCVPASVTIGRTEFTTSLIPKDGRYAVPIKARVRELEDLELGDEVHLTIRVAIGQRGPRTGA